MRKLVAILVGIMMVVSLVACGGKKSGNDKSGEQAEVVSLVGSWAYEENSAYVYTFNDDGTGSYLFNFEMPFTYEEDGLTISILFEGNSEPMELGYKIVGDRFIITDSFGSEVVYIRK